VCFNQPLANKLKKDVETLGNVTATTFHALCGDMINRSGLSEIITIDNRDEYYTHILPEWLPDAAQKLREKFDAVIVDEGQDFLPHWMTALEMLLTDRNDSVMAVFGDSNQAIFTPGWEPPFDTDPVELSINCRNTRQIAERIKATIEGARELRDQFDFGPSELTVLASSRALVSALIDSDAQEFSETPTQNQTLVETIHRFKGLENEGILLALDPEANTDDVDRLGYVGMSRARQVLRIIASKTDLQSLSWD
jgi:superfamily I DNA/RNA helicase